ncbi:MAG: alpha/beta hydrolase [Pseudomonadota bacterium]|nr:alpha/beta hydrolase [Pseudomonadota bacterium]
MTRSWLAALLVTVLMLAGCAPLPDDEAAWVLGDLAAEEGPSRLKERTPDPARRPVAYTLQGRDYQGDLYLPGELPRAGIVLVPGVAARGKDDPRLVSFATTLARTRFLVLVPNLPNLRALRVRAEDAQGVADAFSHLLARPEFPTGGRAGIGAFSYAVGPAVLAALEPAIRERVDFVLGVGGYYDLEQVITFFTTGYFQQNGKWQYLEPNRYGKWVFVLGNAERLSDPRDRSAFRAMAERRLNDPQARIDDLSRRLTPKGRALLALLENRDRERTTVLIARLPAGIRVELDALNLANKDLSRLRARLILPHGTDDAIIPYTESMALAAALPPGRAELFLIDGLAHVDVRPLGLDRRAMWRAIHALLAQRNHPGEGRQ